MLPIVTNVFKIQEIETRHTQNGKQVTQLNLSCGEKNSKGEWQNLYIKATFWEKQSEYVSQYFKKGDHIQVQGKLVTENYTKQDGTKVYETKFLFPNCASMPKQDSQNNAQQHQSQPRQNNYNGQQPQQNQPNYNAPQGQPSYPNQGQQRPPANVPQIDIDDDE